MSGQKFIEFGKKLNVIYCLENSNVSVLISYVYYFLSLYYWF